MAISNSKIATNQFPDILSFIKMLKIRYHNILFSRKLFVYFSRDFKIKPEICSALQIIKMYNPRNSVKCTSCYLEFNENFEISRLQYLLETLNLTVILPLNTKFILHHHIQN